MHAYIIVAFRLSRLTINLSMIMQIMQHSFNACNAKKFISINPASGESLPNSEK